MVRSPIRPCLRTAPAPRCRLLHIRLRPRRRIRRRSTPGTAASSTRPAEWARRRSRRPVLNRPGIRRTRSRRQPGSSRLRTAPGPRSRGPDGSCGWCGVHRAASRGRSCAWSGTFASCARSGTSHGGGPCGWGRPRMPIRARGLPDAPVPVPRRSPGARPRGSRPGRRAPRDGGGGVREGAGARGLSVRWKTLLGDPSSERPSGVSAAPRVWTDGAPAAGGLGGGSRAARERRRSGRWRRCEGSVYEQLFRPERSLDCPLQLEPRESDDVRDRSGEGSQGA